MDEFTLIEQRLVQELETNRDQLNGLIAGVQAIQAARKAQREHLIRIQFAAKQVIALRDTGVLQTAIDQLESVLQEI